MNRLLIALISLAAILALGFVLPVHAAETGAPPPAAQGEDTKPPAKAEGGKEEGGKKKEGEGGEGEGAKKKGGSGDVSGGRFAGDPIYVHIAPLILPIIDANGVEQIVTIQIAVEVRDFDVADDIHSNMPRVRDALMRGLYGGLGNGNLRSGKLVDVTKIKNRATTMLSEVLGNDTIRNVLIEGVAQRML